MTTPTSIIGKWYVRSACAESSAMFWSSDLNRWVSDAHQASMYDSKAEAEIVAAESELETYVPTTIDQATRNLNEPWEALGGATESLALRKLGASLEEASRALAQATTITASWYLVPEPARYTAEQIRQAAVYISMDDAHIDDLLRELELRSTS